AKRKLCTFVFSSRRRHTRSKRDWSSDVCSSDLTVALKDYAGDGKEVTVYAVDYSGNRSKEVKLDNPYYEEPAQTQAASSAAPQSSSGETQAAPSQTPAPSPSSNNASGNSESSQAAETPSASQEETGASSESSDTEDETESAVPEGAFTPEGTGTVLDSATGQEDDKQFYTRSEEHTSELQSRFDLVCRLLLEKKRSKLHSRSSL